MTKLQDPAATYVDVSRFAEIFVTFSRISSSTGTSRRRYVRNVFSEALYTCEIGRVRNRIRAARTLAFSRSFSIVRYQLRRRAGTLAMFLLEIFLAKYHVLLASRMRGKSRNVRSITKALYIDGFNLLCLR